MINNINNSVKFCAKCITTIKYNDDKHAQTLCEATFVEINPKHDKQTMKTLTNEWYNAPYVKNIYEDTLELEKKNPRINSKIFALTKQRKNLINLESRQILGILEITTTNKKTPYIEFLQVDPLMKNSHIGTNILNILKKMHSSIELHSSASALEFYIKNGFEIINPLLLHCKWIKK